MPPRSTGSSTSKIVFMVLGIVAFGAGLFRGFYEPQLPASAIAHTGEATLKGGPHSLTEMETTLARQQRMIEELLENQKEQKELLKVQQQQQQHAEAFMAATDGDDEPSEEEDKQQLEEVGGEDDFDATKKKKKKKVNPKDGKAGKGPAGLQLQHTYTVPPPPAPPVASSGDKTIEAKRRNQEVKPATPKLPPTPSSGSSSVGGQKGGSGGQKGGGGQEGVGHSFSAKGWEPAVVAHTLENTIKAATKTRTLLKERYGEQLYKAAFTLDEHILYSKGMRERAFKEEAMLAAATAASVLQPPTPVFLDHSSRQLLVKRMLAKLAAPKTSKGSKEFVVAFGGHSSAAAHGNLFNQSYAHAFERLLSPVFQAAGLDLVVRNHAMGGTGCVPSAYCAGNVYGTDLDAISWDFGMTDGRNIDHGELYYRQAILQNQAARPGSLPPLLLLAHNTDNLREGLMQHYSRAGFEVAGIRMNQAMDLVPKTESAQHASTLPDALQFLECADSIPWEDCKAQRYDCVQQCGEEKGKICHGQVSWHPGWRYHQYKGDLLATPFLEALSDAARKYQSFTMEMGPVLDPEYFATPNFPADRPLPASLHCGVKATSSSVDALFCDTPFQCATSFEPRTGPGPLDLLAPNKGKGKAKAPVAGGSAPVGGGWKAFLAPGEGDNTASCTGHRDQKFNVLGQSGSEWLSMPLKGVSKGVLIVCEGPFSAREKSKVGYLNTSSVGGNAQFEVDGQGPKHYQRKLSKSLCSVVSDGGGLSPGDHTLAIKALGPRLTGFSHVIWA
mmetsp:Transcript_27387/g.49738  ORF Transcript_27387/g.49738 Transcript_27387/m.49738 type:complete len:783 (+) Transcript_27387:70-2418(+)